MKAESEQRVLDAARVYFSRCVEGGTQTSRQVFFGECRYRLGLAISNDDWEWIKQTLSDEFSFSSKGRVTRVGRHAGDKVWTSEWGWVFKSSKQPVEPYDAFQFCVKETEKDS